MKTFLFYAAMLVSYPFVLFAQNDTLSKGMDYPKTTLSEIVVTANRTETPYYSLASSVTVITAEVISKHHLNTVVDVLREVPGISIIQQGGQGKISSLFMRGANSNHTLVFIDGVKMNDASSPNNAFDFSTLNTNDIEKIEIVRGPQSTLYGSDAIAGVVNIITKQSLKKQNYSFSIEGGSYSFYKGNLSMDGNYGIMNYYLSALSTGSKGISASNSKYGNTENDGFSNNSLTSKFSLNFLPYLKLNFLYKYTKLKTDLDQNEKLGDDPNFKYKVEEQLFKSNIKLNLFDDKWEQLLSASLVKSNRNSIDEFDAIRPSSSSDSYNRAQRIKFDWQNNLHFLSNNLITLGIETELEKANTSYISNSQWGPYESIFPEKSARTTGIYLQDQINLANSFFASLGLRLDKHEKFGSITTFRIAPAYYFNATNTKIKISYGTGFKAPSLYYLFDPLYGNPDLKPEESKGWDLGIEQYLANGAFSFGITYFKLNLSNMFGYDANFRTINIAKASSKGLEIFATVSNFKRFSINSNYTFNETKDEYENSSDYNKPLLRRPKHQLFLSVGYKFNDVLTFATQIKYVGKRDDKDFSTYPAQRVTMPDYTIVNFSTTLKLFNYLELYGRIENLFDKDYEEVLYYGTLGRSFYLGCNLNL